MKKITIKLALFFILLISISSILVFLISTFFTDGIKNEVKTNQKAIATSISELKQRSDLTVDEIIAITSSSMFDISIIEDINLVEITEEELSRIQNNEIVFIYHGIFHNPKTILMIDNSYIHIGMHPNGTIFEIVTSRIWFSIFLYILIGASLTSLSAKKMVNPILRLASATQEVAKGNFDVQVKNESKDEVGLLTKNFNKMTKELKNIEYLRKDFISNVSHEFKTPIASIQGFVKLLQKGNLSEDEKQEYTSIIVEETERLSNLSSNILKLSKLENQEIIDKNLSFSLDEQIRKSILLLEHQWSKKNIEFNLELNKILYFGDEELLQQVWINIISNGIKFSNKNSIIDIVLIKSDSNIIVKIRDYGVGMDERTKKRVFEKFYQGNEAHSHEGNGLGLALVKRIIDLYDGSINVESEINEGTTFIVQLPLE
ncbi:sensor histidine kinase [Sporosalibacterium faouarense]|uniref:sensor histidine kinase n=1 Tax=Sporosalibacterium faouarense TaxID=516123 RepID=UPI00141C3437|nr:HAMP domain-containing sensor histidine kinase [Sporosalibacterium faouarense]MTI47156.1 HAMP domain-containing histidine kinase [Bacillota bacterium]